MKDTKQYILTGLLLIVVAAASYYIGTLRAEVKFYEGNLANLNNPTAPQPQGDVQPYAPSDAEIKLPDGNDYIRGSNDAKYALIEYSDYDCPYCSRFHATAKSLVDEYDGELMWVYRHFPLVQIHPDAEKKALAAECVAKQGGSDGFWAFTDALLESEAPVTDLEGTVTQLGYDANAFTSCVENGDTQSLVDEDVATATTAGVAGTPGNFLVNLETGDVVELFGALPYELVKEAIGTL